MSNPYIERHKTIEKAFGNKIYKNIFMYSFPRSYGKTIITHVLYNEYLDWLQWRNK